MKKILVILLLLFAFGCPKKYTPPAEETVSPEDAEREEMVTTETEEIVEEEGMEDVVIYEKDDVSESDLSIDERAKEIFKDLLFDYDKYDIRPEARPILDAIAEFLKENEGTNIVIEGHCDDRGTNEYNLALGEKRAKAAKNYLVSRGVSPDRMIVITFGEEKPLCMEQNESCWQKNRRAHFVSVRSRFQ
jgi:peptidoglycan-associated lipoprotein